MNDTSPATVTVPAAQLPDEDGQIIFAFTIICCCHTDCVHHADCKGVHADGTFDPKALIGTASPGFYTNAKCVSYLRRDDAPPRT